MLADPSQWRRHLSEEAGDLRVQRHFAYADRIRYYWPRPEAQAALGDMRAALQGRTLADPLLRQGFSDAVLDRAEGLGDDRVTTLLQASVQEVLAPYFFDDAP